MNFKTIKFVLVSMERQEFFSYSWCIDEAEKEATHIRIYGLSKENETVCVTVKNFTPYVYLQLPEHIEWTIPKAQLVVSKLNSLLTGTNEDGDYDYRPQKTQLMYKKRLYYTELDKNGNRKLFPYICCMFSNVEHIRQFSFRVRRPIKVNGFESFTLKIHEQNASPILQLTSLRKLPTAGWISFIGRKLTNEEEKLTFCKHEYVVKWQDMSPINSDIVARPYLLSYDIEVYSADSNRMPRANTSTDVVFQISCVLARQGSKADKHERYILTLGNPIQKEVGENVHILTFKTESELLLGFVDFLREKQPNVVIGYNIFGFDIPYMLARSKHLLLGKDFTKQGFNKYGYAKERLIEWSSSAYKNQSFEFLDAEGIIFVDLLPLAKRDMKLSSYTLKAVSAHVLKDMTKDPLDAKGIFKCYKTGVLENPNTPQGRKAISLVAKYCVKDSELVMRLFETLTTWIALCEMSKVTNVPIFSLYTQGQQLKVFSQAYRKCTHENTVVEKDGYLTKDDDHYVGATVLTPTPGVYDNVVPFDFSSLYPSVVISYNICWSTLVLTDAIPDSECNVMEWEDHFGCAHDPKEIRKAEVIKILKKRDEELKELRRQRDLKMNKSRKEEFQVKIAEFIKATKPLRDERTLLQKGKGKHVICAKRKFRWLKAPMGVLPEILSHLLDTRASTKKEMKSVKERLKKLSESDEQYQELSTYYDVLDQRQLALKVSANSGYGCMGVRRGYLPFMPGAMATTYMGRQAIEKAAKTIQERYRGVLIYGDTDSNYVSFPHIKSIPECWDYAIKVAGEVSKLFPEKMKLAFEEKIYTKFLIITKKRYMCLSCERDGIVSEKIANKGVLLSRRDNCAFVRKVYGDVVLMIFHKAPKNEIINYVLDELNKLCGHFYSTDSFVITKSIGDVGDLVLRDGKDKNDKDCKKIGDYKIRTSAVLPSNEKERKALLGDYTEKEYYLECLPAQVQLAEKMRNRGQLVSAGSRIEYVITTTGGHLAKQYTKVESLDYFKKHHRALQIDYLYYIKLLVNPLDQILDIIFEKEQKGFVAQQYKYRCQIREKLLNELKSLTAPKLKFVP